MGIPLIRLRTALPDELCGGWTIGTALGRAHGLSLNFMNEAKEDHDRAVMAARKRKLPTQPAAHGHAGRIPSSRFASLDSEVALVISQWPDSRSPWLQEICPRAGNVQEGAHGGHRPGACIHGCQQCATRR